MRDKKVLFSVLLSGIILLGCAVAVISLAGDSPEEDWVPPAGAGSTKPTTQTVFGPQPLPEVHAASIAHHGGKGYAYPQNTVENITACANDGWKMVEFDVRWTSDDVPVLSHEDERAILDSEETISVSGSTYEELKAVRLYEDETIHISAFADVIEVCKQYGMTAFIEFKVYPTSKQLDAMMDHLRQQDMLDHCVWVSFNLDPLIAVTKRHPQATVMLNLSNAPEISWLDEEPRIAKLLDRDGQTVLAYNYLCLSRLRKPNVYLNKFKDAGFAIGVWTLDDPDLIRKYAGVADYISSNIYTVEKGWDA